MVVLSQIAGDNDPGSVSVATGLEMDRRPAGAARYVVAMGKSRRTCHAPRPLHCPAAGNVNRLAVRICCRPVGQLVRMGTDTRPDRQEHRARPDVQTIASWSGGFAGAAAGRTYRRCGTACFSVRRPSGAAYAAGRIAREKIIAEIDVVVVDLMRAGLCGG